MEPAATTLVWNTVTTDAAYPRHVVHAQLRMLQAQPGTIVLEIILAPAILLSLTAGIVGAFVVLILVGVAGTLHLLSRRQVRKLIPAGSVYRAALGTDTLVTEAPLGNAALPYAIFGRIRVSRHVVLLQNSRGKQWLALPREVFPGTVLDDLRERIRVAPQAAAFEPPGGVPAPGGTTGSWTTDAGYPKRVARAILAESFSPVRTGVIALVLVAVAVVAVVVTDAPTGTGLGMLAFAVVMLAIAFALIGRSVRLRMAKQIPAGSSFRVAIGADQLWIDLPGTTGYMAYTMFRSLRLRGDIVLLRTVQAGQFIVLPAQLFSQQSLRELRDRIAVAQASV